MKVRTSENGSRRSSSAERVHSALLGFGRNLLTVDDPTLDLPVRQLKVCLALLRRSRSMSEISREIGLSPSAVTQVSDRLVRRGLVERAFQDEDRRVRKLKLTTKGLHLMRSHEEKQLRRIAAALASLPELELDQMLAGLEILTRSCTATERAAC
ncbi:MAG TPA: MarR family transcriptional regulator [Lacipirellulaceae bacterium]|jgi:DNA-binding MarR family transcriptional regulator